MNGVFRDLPFMGVIRVNNEAMRHGWTMGDPAWSNLGQGQPEVGEIRGAPPRIRSIALEPEDHAYGPVEGTAALREAVAAHYNRLYRRGLPSQYTADHVAIASGGRLALSRLGACLDITRLGYFTPDYTAYEDLFTTFQRIEPVHIPLEPAEGFRIAPQALRDLVARERLDSLLLSNPCNPTGVVIHGEELARWVALARETRTTLLLDEFYSHYFYPEAEPGTVCDAENPEDPGPVSAAAFVEDVDEDPVILVDGLTKCYRYPGWRVGWVVGPPRVIRTLTAAGSFLDGGPGRPIQRAALTALEPRRADLETAAVRDVFREKQELTLSRLRAMGVGFPAPPQGTFYVFGRLSDLPVPLRDGQAFMRAAFRHRVLTVPGEFFDVNPGRARGGPSPLASFARFSFGPPIDNLRAGLDRLEEMIGLARLGRELPA